MSSTGNAILTAVWAASVIVGFLYLADYETTPGRDGAPPTTWPVASQLTRDADQPTMILFAHARCPCTRASIGELERLMVHAKDRSTVHVLLFDPEPCADDWTKTDLWASANAIPGVRVARDPDRREAGLFGAVTSGQMLFYDAEGRLQFGGGITGSRGHAGDNVGSQAVTELLRGRDPVASSTPVFGCSLTDPCCEPTATDRTP